MTDLVWLLVLAPPVLVTSLAGLLLGFGRRLTCPGLLRAARLGCEILGLATLFLVANVALGLALVLALRQWSSAFVSAYPLQDVTLAILSLLQGLVFGLWRRRP
jgi:hypothetical protein